MFLVRIQAQRGGDGRGKKEDGVRAQRCEIGHHELIGRCRLRDRLSAAL